MCSVGDIIVIEHPIRDGQDLGRHSYIVLSTENGQIEGMDFDLVCNVMGSFDGKGNEYKEMKLSYPENIAYQPSDVNVPGGNSKEGYIKAGVLFYFDKSQISYHVIGQVKVELFTHLLHYIESLEEISYVTDNLSQ